MKLQDLIEKFEEIIMVDSGTISLDSNLNEFIDWDSLAKLSLISLFEEELNIKIGFSILEDVQIFEDIVEIVKDQLEK